MTQARAKNSIDMTSGALLPKMLSFMLPLALSGILQLLFNAADLAVIGQFSATPEESLAAVSSNGALINLIVNLAIGLSVGTNIVLAQAIGSRDEARAGRILHTSMTVAAILGVFLGVFGFILSHTFLVWMRTDISVIGKATTYLRIYFLGMPANIIFNFGSSVLRAKGDTKRPLRYLTVAGAVNVLLNLAFVTLFDMDVAGVATATIAAQYLSCALVVIALIREDGCCRMYIDRLRVHKKELLDVMKVGLPSGVQGMFFSISNVIIQSSINALVTAGYGAALMSGNATGANIEGFVYVTMNAASTTAATFVGQNYGAGEHKRILRVIFTATALVIAASTLLGGTFYIFGHQVASLYSQSESIIAYALDRMHVILPLYFLCGTVEVVVGGLRGIGHPISTIAPALFSICVYRIVWVHTVFAFYRTPAVLYMSYPISWTINLIIDAVLFAYFYKKLVKPKKEPT